MNGVFLVALCLSIVLDAIQRFVEPQEVSSPKLVLIVGCCGLASNILGLALFHDHGHSHGGHSHGNDAHSAAEEGHSHSHDVATNTVGDEAGRIADVLPESTVGNGAPPAAGKSSGGKSKDVSWKDHGGPTDNVVSPATSKRNGRRHSRSRSRAYSNRIDDIYVHPASFRSEIIAAARGENEESATDTENEDAILQTPSEETPLLKSKTKRHNHSHDQHSHGKGNGRDDGHENHNHRKPKDSSKGGHGHGHSHGDLNMRGVFLHVLGDALGNIGVIASALVIWLTDFWWRFYADPAISLIITIIILTTAIPLCKAASRILLQAVPAGISIDELREDIEELPGIISAHHIHVWQLSDTKIVASLHVQVEFDFKGEGSAQYMELARAIRKCLHEYGIHSSTIQPEFCVDTAATLGQEPDYSSCEEENRPGGSANGISKKGSKSSSLNLNGNTCLLECGDECGNGQQCCAPGTSTSRSGSDDGK